MAETILQTRIQLKIDTWQAWQDESVAGKGANLVLKNGEPAFCYIPANTGSSASTSEPAVLMKVGDGATAFKNLPWASGPAADVYSWAKAKEKPVYAATEITGIDTFISQYVNEQMGISVDTDTQYTITKVNDYQFKLMSKSKSDANYATEVAVIDIPNDTAAIQALQTLVGQTAVATQIANAISALNLAETYEAKGEAAKVQTALNEYKTSNDAAVKKVSDDLASEIQTARAAEQANAGAISAIKDGASIDSFADVESALAGKQAVGDYATKSEAQAMADGKDAAIAAAKAAGDNAQSAADAAQAAAEAAQGAADKAQGEVDALELLVGSLPDGSSAANVIAYVDEKTSGIASDEALTQLGTRVTANADAIAAIEADYLKNADKTELTEAIATAKQEAIEAVLDGVTDDFDTLKEVAAWIQADTTASAELISRISAIEADYLKGADRAALQGEIDALEALVGTLPAGAASTTVVAYIQEVVDALKISDYAKASELSALAGRVTTAEGKISTLEGKSHEHSNKQLLDTYTQTEVNLADAVSKKHAHSNQAELDLIASGDKAKWDAAAAIAHEHANASVLNGITAAQVSAWDKVSEKADDSALSAIAKSGNVSDLIQTSGDVIVFDCGSSTVNV